MKTAEIFARLQDIQKNALAGFSHFRVAALVETEDGQMFSGFNIESRSYGLTICAERVALFKALSEGSRKFKRIYLLCDGEQACSPCGACRQVIMDYAPDVEIIMFDRSGKSDRMSIRDLLPRAFGPEHLTKPDHSC